MSGESPDIARSTLLRLLAQAQSSSGSDRPPPEAVDYDWATPSAFTSGQWERVETFAERLAHSAAAVLDEMLAEPTKLHVGQTTQHYASQLEEQGDLAGGYSGRLLDVEGATCGVIALSGDLARRWVAELLGGADGEPAGDREFSALEDTLVGDILAALTRALADAQGDSADGAFRLDEQVVRGSCGLPGDASRALTRIGLCPEGQPETRNVSLTVLSEALAGIVDPQAARQPTGDGADSRTRLIEHLQAVPVTVSALLGDARISARDLVALERGDVLVMQRRVDEPIDLVVNDQAVLTGLPVTCKGRYALQIVPSGRADEVRTQESS